ncbi:MAG: hypothetical protein H6740_20855 [Alphaproteobacteria bacterium]|nr:hypothetical protein [Alphaproteobacteria bacterium]
MSAGPESPAPGQDWKVTLAGQPGLVWAAGLVGVGALVVVYLLGARLFDSVDRAQSELVRPALEEGYAVESETLRVGPASASPGAAGVVPGVLPAEGGDTLRERIAERRARRREGER